jgi:nitrate/TMAO reductase-like tetraheme cytochrome c subunit
VELPQAGSGHISRRFLTRRRAVIAGVVALALVGWCLAYEPVTRNFVAADPVCSYCHLQREYRATARMSFSKPHPVEPKQGTEPARCVECHLPEGFWAATFAYTHFASATDLYGHFRDRPAERAGDWIPLSAARANRVRDRLFEHDSVTCRSCHIEAEIKPKRPRGQKAHADALKNKETCIECHANLVHRFVEVRGAKAETGAGEEGLDEGVEKGLEETPAEGAGATEEIL